MMSPGCRPRAGAVNPAPPLGPDPSPFALTTNNVRPSRDTDTADVNQPAGMYPSTFRLAVSTTATAFSPAHATYNRVSSGLSATPNGIVPRCLSKLCAASMGISARTEALDASSTVTVSFVAFDT